MTQPLLGRTVLVTRASEQAASTSEALRARGARAIEIPTIVVRPPTDPAPLAQAVRALARYDVVAVTSANGVDALARALDDAGLDARALGGALVAAIGRGTERALARRGLAADVVAEEHRGEALAAAIVEALRSRGRAAGGRVLVAQAEVAREALRDGLRAAQVEVEVVAAYRTTPPSAEQIARARAALTEAAGEGRAQAIALFTASSTVDNLCAQIAEAPELLAELTVASLGPITSATCRARGVRVDVEASPYTIAAVLDALEAHFSRRSG